VVQPTGQAHAVQRIGSGFNASKLSGHDP
jgi:hypothetical protein